MDSFLKKHFFFLRHGETDWNYKKLCQGQKDIPLNKKGLQEAKEFAVKSRNLNIGCIVSGPLNRALATAKEIHKVHSDTKLYIAPELSERYWGSIEGMTSEEMYSREILEEEDPLYSQEQGIEPKSSFRQRVSQGIIIAQKYHPHPLVVSHGRVFRELCFLLGIPPLRQLPNCQLIKIFPSGSSWESCTLKENLL